MKAAVKAIPIPVLKMSTRHHESSAHLAPAFGSGWFGELAEKIARFFGSPTYLITLTCLVLAWITINAAAVALRWDPYPFILLNLTFSTQSAYAAPLILLAQTRQAQRDKAWSAADARHREQLQAEMMTLLQQNTDLTRRVAELTDQRDEIEAQMLTLLNQNTDLTRSVAEITAHLRDLTQEIHRTVTTTPKGLSQSATQSTGGRHD
jgi:uncharacterized membrane protein